MDDGRWTVDDGRWTVDGGRWTMDDGPWTLGHAINNFVTSRIEHTPYETFLAVYFLFLQLRQAINHFVASSSRNIDFDWPRSLFFISLRSCVTKKDHF